MKRKILNDPIYGFINMPDGIGQAIVEHPWFQRLRNIRQLGLTYLVYPGAIHSRFQHTLGAYHLITNAIEAIRSKGHEITDEEAQAVEAAILLHDIGHGPFSHALEHTLAEGVSHENISLMFMSLLNQQLDGQLDMAIRIFCDNYPKHFLHQLVSSQLDMDRLDYLNRDSFFTGVSEGVVGADRIIKMLNVVDDKLVVEAKGIYSIEKFLIARRLMYWQVYLHKTVLSAEQLLVKALKRARQLAKKGISVEASYPLSYFLTHQVSLSSFESQNGEISEVLQKFSELDDSDIFVALKQWTTHSDKVLSMLSSALQNRRLLKIEMQKDVFDDKKISGYRKKVKQLYGLDDDEAAYFVFTDSAANHAYSVHDDRITILYKNNDLVDIAEASDILNLSVLSKDVVKYFFCFPEGCRNIET